MKKEKIAFDYRKYYKEYYGITFDKDLEIHHLDWDRSNNDISNLLLIPKATHEKFHFACNAISSALSKYGSPKDLHLDPNGHTYDVQMAQLYFSAIEDMDTWNVYKTLGYEFCYDNRVTLKNK